MIGKILKVSLFGVAFGFVEAAVVLYLRNLLGVNQAQIGPSEILFRLPGIAFLQPQTAIELINKSHILAVEQIREAATLTMLFSVAVLAGERWRERLAFFLIAFGLWDIFYYVFLKAILSWPNSFFDLDILFLLPVPWVAPIIVPIIISLVWIIGSLIYLLRR